MEDHEPDRVFVDGRELGFEPEPGGVDEIHTALPPRLESWRRRSVVGALMTGISLGLKEALEPQRDEPAIVAQVSGDPVGDLPVEAHVDGILPANSVVTIRAWLLEGSHPAAEPGDRDEPWQGDQPKP